MPPKENVVWVISPFSDPDSESSDRYRYICQELTDRGASVIQFVSSFDHALKRRRRRSSNRWRHVLVFEPGYRRNVSVRRILSHVVFDVLLVLYLMREMLRSGLPDAIFAALPHNGAACVAAICAKALGVPFVVDVHDTWPESFLSVSKLNPLTRLGYRAWKACADFALRRADGAFGESVRYAERANGVRIPVGRSPAQAIYLGGDLPYYEGIQPVAVLPDELKGATFIAAYAGTLGRNYDLDCVIDAFSAFAREVPDAGLMLLGGGERETSLRSRISSLGLRAWISGRIPHPALIGYLGRANVGLNCFKAGGNVAYSYKLNDYLLSGLPVINDLEGESADFIRENRLGMNYVAGDSSSLLEALRACRAEWRANPAWRDTVIAFSSKMLDRRMTYRPLIENCLGR